MAKVTGSSTTTTIQFSVSEISKLTSVRSPEVLMYGFPWQIQVGKQKNGTQESLTAYLQCTRKDNTSNWAVAACATIRLLPFNDDQRAVEHYISPYVYNRLVYSYGTRAFLTWNDLFNKDNKYVKDDTIRLELKIEADDPISVSRSIPKFQCIDKICECGCQATFELTIMNISNLLAVRSSEFIMRGMPWCIMVFKNGTKLGVLLALMQHTGNVSCQATMSVKLMSSKKGVDSIEQSKAKNIRCDENLYMGNLVAWEDILKPENGFVNGNSITLNIEVKSGKPVGNVPVANPNGAAKPNPFECSICLEGLGTKEMSTTPCGHSFCTACIDKVVRNRPACPLCNKAVQVDDLRPLFLSAAK